MQLPYIEIKFFGFSTFFTHSSNFSSKNRIRKKERNDLFCHIFYYCFCYIKQKKILKLFWPIIIAFFFLLYFIFWWKILLIRKTHRKPEKLYFYIRQLQRSMNNWVNGAVVVCWLLKPKVPGSSPGPCFFFLLKILKSIFMALVNSLATNFFYRILIFSSSLCYICSF